MARRISEERKATYYLGAALMVAGGLTFLSVFITGAMHFGDFSDFESRTKSSMFRAILGMVLVVVGGVIRAVGSRGLAGSGVVLDPERARSDVEPYSRMAGGMVKDALDEADLGRARVAIPAVMVRCTACRKLNAEDSKFCQECGKLL